MLFIFCTALICFILAGILSIGHEFFDDILENILSYSLYRKILFILIIVGLVLITIWLILVINWIMQGAKL